MATMRTIRASMEAVDGGWGVEVPASWTQGRTIFGGLVGALAAESMERTLGAEAAPLRSLDVLFLAPLVPGRVTLRTRVLRAGRSVTWCEADVLDAAGALASRATGVFGAARPTTMTVELAAPRLSSEPDDVVPIPFVPGLTPEFTRHFDLRYTDGSFPYTGSDDASLGGWVRHGEDPGHAVGGLIAAADAWPPAILGRADGAIPASTARWTLHVVETPADARGWFGYRARTLVAGEGYATQTSELMRGGRVVAWSEQLVAYFPRPAGG